MNHNLFIFERYSFKPETGVLDLTYRFENGPSFNEQIVFPPVTRNLSSTDKMLLDHALRLLFLLAGVSYYKACAPPQLKCEAFALDPVTAALVEKIYRNGLGEFSYKNNLDLTTRVNFVSEKVAPPQAAILNLPRHLCIPVGGGKDSVVALEMLKAAGEPITLFALGNASGIAAPIAAVVAMSGLPVVKVARTLSTNLFGLNKAGAYNGHVPITAILSAITVACSIMQGFDTIVMANEHSASVPNLRFNDAEINHQYSKSFAFEKDFAAYIKAHITPSLTYFSLLRPLSESAIMQRFASMEKYHPIFRSCNTAFRQDDKRRNANWCCDCPKCRFVFLAFAPFTPKQHLVDIFGTNLLNDAAQESGFAELCGLTAYKPFECVGEIEESALLMEKLRQTPEWANDAVVSNLGTQIARQPKVAGKSYSNLFDIYPDHQVPEHYLRYLHARA